MSQALAHKITFHQILEIIPPKQFLLLNRCGDSWDTQRCSRQLYTCTIN